MSKYDVLKSKGKYAILGATMSAIGAVATVGAAAASDPASLIQGKVFVPQSTTLNFDGTIRQKGMVQDKNGRGMPMPYAMTMLVDKARIDGNYILAKVPGSIMTIGDARKPIGVIYEHNGSVLLSTLTQGNGQPLKSGIDARGQGYSNVTTPDSGAKVALLAKGVMDSVKADAYAQASMQNVQIDPSAKAKTHQVAEANLAENFAVLGMRLSYGNSNVPSTSMGTQRIIDPSKPSASYAPSQQGGRMSPSQQSGSGEWINPDTGQPMPSGRDGDSYRPSTRSRYDRLSDPNYRPLQGN